jgi:hypothetical protein
VTMNARSGLVAPAKMKARIAVDATIDLLTLTLNPPRHLVFSGCRNEESAL